MRKKITYEDICKSEEIKIYIKEADFTLSKMGFTEHAQPHVKKVAKEAGDLLKKLGYDEHTVELARISGYMHDIGNVINRIDHAQSGAIMAFRILDNMGMECQDIAKIISAIGNHDESTAHPVNEIAAALVIADKSDVRRSRVRPLNKEKPDIHDRVNYAVVENSVKLDIDRKEYILNLTIDTTISPVIDYFEIFLERMKLCSKAAKYLGLEFKLLINGAEII